MKVTPSEEPTRADDAAIEALSETEQQVWTALQQWSELFALTSERSGRTRKGKRGSGGATVNLNEAAVSLIDSIMPTLVELRSELQKVGRQPKNH